MVGVRPENRPVQREPAPTHHPDSQRIPIKGQPIHGGGASGIKGNARRIAAERIVRLGAFSELAALEGDAVVFAVGNIVGSGQIPSEDSPLAGVLDVR